MKNSAGTWLSVLNHFLSSDPASLDQVSHWKPDPPALNLEGKASELTLRNRAGHTHGAAWRKKALETKERKTERAALRGQERKIGVEKRKVNT